MRPKSSPSRDLFRLFAPLATAICVFFAAAYSADAKGAFAAGIPDDVAKNGAAFGASYNYPTREAAEERAMQECRKQDSPADTLALCKVMTDYENQCVAVSIDPKAGTPGFGWGLASDAGDANSRALSNCQQSAGSDRAAYCQITLTECDGTATTH